MNMKKEQKKRIPAVPLSLLGLVLVLALTVGCSGDKEEETKPGAVRQITNQLGADAARQIQVPIEKAQQVQGIEDQYSKQLQEAGQ